MRRFSKSFLLINTCRNFYSTKYFHSASLKFLKRVDPKLKYISNCTHFNVISAILIFDKLSGYPCYFLRVILRMINMNLNTNLLINLYEVKIEPKNIKTISNEIDKILHIYYLHKFTNFQIFASPKYYFSNIFPCLIIIPNYPFFKITILQEISTGRYSFHRLEESKEQRGIALSSLCRHYTDCPFGDPSSFNFKHPPPTQQSPLRSDPRFCLRPRVSRAE